MTTKRKRDKNCEEGDDTDFNASLRRRTALNVQPDMLNLSRREWEEVFFHNLVDPIKQYIKSLYASAMKKSNSSGGVELFVENIKNISEWTPNELAFVIGKLKLDNSIDFQELLKFIVMSKGLLLTYPSQSLNESYSIDIEVPKFSKYIHDVFIEIAKKIKTQPHLASQDGGDEITYFQKDKKLSYIVQESLKNVLMHKIPCDKFLQKNVKGLMQYTNFEAKKNNSIVPVDPEYQASKKIKKHKPKKHKPSHSSSSSSLTSQPPPPPPNTAPVSQSQQQQQPTQQPQQQQQHPLNLKQQEVPYNQSGGRTMGLENHEDANDDDENSNSESDNNSNSDDEESESEKSKSDDESSDGSDEDSN